jgi:hypothetical protein
MAQSDAYRVLAAQLHGRVTHLARSGSLETPEGWAAAVAELRGLAGDRTGELLAEVGGLALGFGEQNAYPPWGERVHALCLEAGADANLSAEWVMVGRQHAEEAKIPPSPGALRRRR